MSSQKDYVKTALRLPQDLHQAIHSTRKDSERSFNAEIIYRLRQSFPQQQVGKQ